MDTLLADLRYALRSLRKTPGFTFAALLTLALGIGANTAIFSLVNGALIRSLPYASPSSLIVLWGNVQRTVVERRGASYPDFLDWRAQSHSVEDMAAYWDGMTTLEGDQPERIHNEVVTASYFKLLGIGAAQGRLFNEGEDVPGAALVAMLGDSLWTRRFGRDPAIVGKTIHVSGQSCVVIGVLPAGFKGLSDEAEIWQTPAVEDAADLKERGSRFLPVLSRLKPDVSLAQAQTELTQIAKNLERAYPQTNEKRGIEVTPLTTELLGDIQPALLAALAAVGLVLLIACANVTSLLLARAESRSHEMAIRTALGANRGRLYRQLATESLLLTLAAAGLGLLVAHWVTRLLLALSPIQLPSFVHVDLDGRVLLVTLLVAIVIGVLLGFAPAWQIAGGGVQDVLKDSTRTTAGTARHRFRHVIVIAEIALAVMLLAGAGLLMRTLLAIAAIDPGYRTEQLLTLRVGLPELPPAPAVAAPVAAGAGNAAPGVTAPADTESTNLAALAVLDRVRAVPGVMRAAAGSDMPLGGVSSAVIFTAQGQPPVNATNRPRAYRHRVTPGFIETLGLRLMAGQDFVDADMQPDARRVIVSETLVQRFWPGERGIGRQIKLGQASDATPWLTISGVVAESKYRGLPRNSTADPDIYLPFMPRVRNFALVLHTSVPPDSLIGAVRQAVREVEPGATLSNVSSMAERVREQMARPRFVSWLVGAFAGLALMLAAIGIYGVLAQTVARRTSEIGLRMALGATRQDILRLVLGQGLWLIGLGLAVGVAGALAVMRLIQSLLFGVSHTDPLTFAGVGVLLGLVALLATWLPAQRATRVDPLVALRHD